MVPLSEICKNEMEVSGEKLNDIFKCHLQLSFTIWIKISLTDPET